jgi:transcriptional regulator with XRE-family HTH domain
MSICLVCRAPNLEDCSMEKLGKNLRTVRVDRETTQEQLAERSGVQTWEISRIEKGKRDPRASTLLKLASALDVEAGRLLN